MPEEEKLELPKEFSKLPPEERIKKLKQLQEALEEKKRKEIESKEKELKALSERIDKELVDKRKKIIKEQERLQQLFRQQTASLEEIAETVPEKKEEEVVLPPAVQSMYNAKKYTPIQDLYQELSAMAQRVQEKGYMSPEEFEKTRAIGYAIESKEERAREGAYTPAGEFETIVDASRRRLSALQSMYRA